MKNNDKDEKPVVINATDYIKACTDHWENEKFQKLYHHKNIGIKEIIKSEIKNLYRDKLIGYQNIKYQQNVSQIAKHLYFIDFQNLS